MTVVAAGTVADLIYWQTILLAVFAGAILLVPLRRRLLLDWIVTLARRVRHTHPPESHLTDFRRDDATPVGLIWTAGTVCTVIEVLPQPGAVTRLGRTVTGTGPTVPLPLLADSLVQQDISLSGIDVIGHGRRTDPAASAAQSYDDLVGPLAATARRTVWLIVRLDVLAQSDAVVRRGGGSTGAARAASVATQRIVRTLAGHGTPTRILPAREIAGVTDEIRGGGTLETAPRSWTHTTVRRGCNTGYSIDPRAIGDRLDDVWATRSHATTVALRLRPGSSASEVRVAASCRFTTDTVPPRLTLRGLIPTSGRDCDALQSHVPGAHPRLDAVTDFATMNLDRLGALTVAAGGCGQLIGADDAGLAVAARIIGPDIRRVSIHAEPYLTHQIVLRAVAIGERIAVHTVDPRSWQSLAGTVADPDRLTVIDDVSLRGDITAVVFDGTEPQPLPDTVTAIVVRETHLVDDPTPFVDDPTVSLVQPGTRGSRIILRTGGTRSELSLVTIAAETVFIGTPGTSRVPATSR